MIIDTSTPTVYLRTDKPISGKIFYTNDNGEVVNKIFQNIKINVDINFNKQQNQPIDKKIEIFVFHSLSRRLLSSSKKNERLLQSTELVKLTVSNKPILISSNNTSSEAGTTSSQYFLYIGVPIITLIVLSGVIFTFVYILKKIKKLKNKSKNKNKQTTSIEMKNNQENKNFNSSNITKNQSEKITDVDLKKSNISNNQNLQSNMPIMYMMPQPQMIQPQMLPQQMNGLQTINLQNQMSNHQLSGIQGMNMQNQLPYMIGSPLSQMSQNQSNVNVFQIPSKFSNQYGISDNTHSNSAKNCNQIPNGSFKSALTDDIHFLARRKSEKENSSNGPILRKNTIRPARNQIEDEFVNSGIPIQPFVANNPFSNNLRMDGGTEMPSDQGDLPLFEIQLEKINEYTPGAKFS